MNIKQVFVNYNINDIFTYMDNIYVSGSTVLNIYNNDENCKGDLDIYIDLSHNNCDKNKIIKFLVDLDIKVYGDVPNDILENITKGYEVNIDNIFRLKKIKDESESELSESESSESELSESELSESESSESELSESESSESELSESESSESELSESELPESESSESELSESELSESELSEIEEEMKYFNCSDNGILNVVQFHNGEIDIDIIFINQDIESYIDKNFDISCVKNYIDNTYKVKCLYEEDVINKIARINKDRFKNILSSNKNFDKFLIRYIKYTNRGYSYNIDNLFKLNNDKITYIMYLIITYISEDIVTCESFKDYGEDGRYLTIYEPISIDKDNLLYNRKSFDFNIENGRKYLLEEKNETTYCLESLIFNKDLWYKNEIQYKVMFRLFEFKNLDDNLFNYINHPDYVKKNVNKYGWQLFSSNY